MTRLARGHREAAYAARRMSPAPNAPNAIAEDRAAMTAPTSRRSASAPTMSGATRSRVIGVRSAVPSNFMCAATLVQRVLEVHGHVDRASSGYVNCAVAARRFPDALLRRLQVVRPVHDWVVRMG